MNCDSTASTSNNATKRTPVLFVIGSTGTGKTNLSIHIAKALHNAEIINIDAMQMYDGFDIATNKVPENERENIVHHLLGSLLVTTRAFRVTDYLHHVLPLIEDCHRRSVIPVIVGGTNYYIESLLYNSFIGQASDDVKNNDKSTNNDDNELNPETDPLLGSYVGLSSDERWQALHDVDPQMAAKLHHNDERRVLRSLQVYLRTGVPHSQQFSQTDNSLRFEDVCVFWVDCTQSILAARTDQRVDKMISAGLLNELVELHSTITAHEQQLQTTTTTTASLQYPYGVMQAIGYKEFTQCFDQLMALSDDTRRLVLDAVRNGKLPENDLNDAVSTAIEAIKINTRKYARAQRKWISRRFVAPNDSTTTSQASAVPIFRLLSDDVDTFTTVEMPRAARIACDFVNGRLNDAPHAHLRLFSRAQGDTTLNWSKKECLICDRVLNGPSEWQSHLASTRHRQLVRQKRQETSEHPN